MADEVNLLGGEGDAVSVIGDVLGLADALLLRSKLLGDLLGFFGGLGLLGCLDCGFHLELGVLGFELVPTNVVNLATLAVLIADVAVSVGLAGVGCSVDFESDLVSVSHFYILLKSVS